MITILPTKTLAETNKQVDLAALWGYEERRDFEWKVAFLLYHPESPIKWVPTKKKLAEAGLYLKKPKEVSTLQIGSELWHEAKKVKEMFPNPLESHILTGLNTCLLFDEKLAEAAEVMLFSKSNTDGGGPFQAAIEWLSKGGDIVTELLEKQRTMEEGPLPKKEKGKEEKEPYNPLAKK